MNLPPISSKYVMRCLLVALLLCIPFFSIAQVPYFEEVPISFQNSDVKVIKILKDKDGWMYFGTDKGLFRYDGISFRKIFCRDTLREETVSAMYLATDGQLWVGFRNGLIARYRNKKFTSFRPEEGLPKVPVTGFGETNDGTFWIATNGEGLYCYSAGHLYNINTDDGLNDNFVHDICSTGDRSAMLVATDQGLNECTFSAGKKNVKDVMPEKGLPDNIITTIAATGNKLIIGTHDKGMCMLDPGYSNSSVPAVSNNWSSGMVNKVIVLGDEYWIATDDNGLVVADTATGKFKFNLKNTDYFQFNKVSDMVCDNEGNVWLASSNGLVKSDGTKIRLIENILNEKVSFIHSILFDSSGNCWFSPDQDLVKMWRDSSGNIRTQKFTISSPGKLIDIVTLYEDPYGYIWIGTMGAGVYRLQVSTGAIKKITEDPAIINGSILTISGKGDEVWIGGFEGTSHCVLKSNLHGNKELNFSRNIVSDSLQNSYVYCVYTDRENRTWFGTDGDGAYVFENGRLRNLQASGLNAGTVYTILEDSGGNIWFNTQDKGLYKYNGKRFQNYSLTEGLSDASMSSMLFDKSGDLYLVHKNGIDILSKNELRFTYLKNIRLLSNMNPDLNSITLSPSGEVYIGTEKFILQLNPSALKNQPFPKTFIESISVFQDEIGDTIHSFSSEKNNFSFAFTGLWYSNPALVQYQYKLDGFNDQWTNTTDREINFPKLSPGTYTFYVRSSLNSDFSNADEASFQFVIHPPFWKTLWFQVPAALVMILLLYLFMKYRDRRIRNMDRLKKEAIEFQFEMLKSQVNPHFLFNSFNTLIAIIEEDQKTAVSYVEKLSEFFRSIVAYRDQNLIPLKEEIHLLDNYFFLQKKRYGQHLNLNQNLDPYLVSAGQIPPLTLQLLVENAIKHNAVSKESPMQIEIFTENNCIIVRNNLNPKMLKERSTGMGLQNITNRYRLFSDKVPEILNDGKTFTVKIPLILKK